MLPSAISETSVHENTSRPLTVLLTNILISVFLRGQSGRTSFAFHLYVEKQMYRICSAARLKTDDAEIFTIM